MDLRRKTRAHIPWRIVLWSLVAIVFVLDILNDTPLHANVDMPSESPVALTREAGSDVVLVLDYAAIAESPNTFSGRDFSAAWINAFEQELGPITIATPQTLTQKLIDEARIIVLTSSVSKSAPEALIKLLRERILSNRLLLVVERPDGLLRERFSADGKVGKQRGETFTFVRNLADPFKQQLLQMPVGVDFIGSTAARDRATTWLSIDGAPAIYDTPIGEGRVITIEFDFGRLLVATQQGRPTESFEVRRPKPHTWDLISDARLKQNPIPFADILERFVIHTVIGSHKPLPFFWLFPSQHDGALIAIHDDAELGDGGAWMLRYEAEKKTSSTLLSSMDSGITADGGALVDRLGGDLGLLWRLQDTPSEILSRFGVGSIQPFARPLDLRTQLEGLRKVATGPVNISMTHSHLWTSDWVAPLSALAASGVRVDLSYSQDQQSGFGFGTGLPFLVVDSSGLPLSIREFPIVIPHDFTAGPSLEKLLEASANGHHQALVYAVRPSAFADYPDMKRFSDWLDVFALASSKKHAILSVNQFDNLQRARRLGSIKSSISTTGEETVIRLTVEAKRRDLEIALPTRVGAKSFHRAIPRGVHGGGFGSSEFAARHLNYSGTPIVLLPLSAGFNTIDVVYR